ncbi:MAG: amidohydrolase [Ectothiorhodospiraceae bacterium]|nr:amidohydrolase [Ectothiorhodospiraceae bacterium]
MNRNRPVATHVAVRDGRILGVGDLESLSGWGEHVLDDQFADHVLMPGFVEGHSHSFEGSVWTTPYVGFDPRLDPDGRTWPGLASIDAVVERLRRAEAELTDPDVPLFAWGFDPIFFGGRRMVAADLDRVSTRRPVVVMHQSCHLLNVNTVALGRAGITRDTDVDGVLKGADGEPTGELQEAPATYMIYRTIGNPYRVAISRESLFRFAHSARNAGITTATDLHMALDAATVETYRAVTAEDDFPLRVVPAFSALTASARDGVARVRALEAFNTEKLRFGLVKIMTDGSIQGFSARLRWPGYFNGAPNGVWNQPPAVLGELVDAYHDAGLQMHAHVNGDEASELMLDLLERALARRPRPDHRYTLQHCQMADAAQFRRMAALGVAVNLFSNHIYYWGDQHAAITMGPDRAERLDAASTALGHGVALAIHCDAPVTPFGPLFTAWCAVNRRTRTGRLLGEAERISVSDALFAITQGAAYTLKLDHLVGSIEPGKHADFAVLDADPLEVAPEALADVRVWGTVVGGRPFPVPRPRP